MLTTVKLNNDLVQKAKKYSLLHHRSVPKQIEHWATIGRVAEDNPDLPYEFIVEILAAKEEGGSIPYVFNTDD